jgi:hypothetical protein
MRLQIVLLEPFQNQILAALMRGVRMATNVDAFGVRYVQRCKIPVYLTFWMFLPSRHCLYAYISQAYQLALNQLKIDIHFHAISCKVGAALVQRL